MIRVYNKHRTYMLTAEDGSTMIVPHDGFAEIPEKFIGDITFRMAVRAGEMEVFETAKQADKIEKKAQEPISEPTEVSEPVSESESKPETAVKEPNAAKRARRKLEK